MKHKLSGSDDLRRWVLLRWWNGCVVSEGVVASSGVRWRRRSGRPSTVIHPIHHFLLQTIPEVIVALAGIRILFVQRQQVSV